MYQILGRQLGMTAKAFRAEFDARLADAGGSLSTWIVLRLAEESALESKESAAEGGLSQRELAERMDIEGPTLVRHLDRLEKEGLIERRRDPRDRRVTRITVTPAGHRLLEALRKVADAMDAEVRSLLTPDEYEVVVQALSRLYAHMKALRADSQEEREVDAHAAR